MEKIKSINSFDSEVLKEFDKLKDEEVLIKLESTSKAHEDRP